MLARLDEIPGVAAAATEASGRFLILDLEGGAEPDRVSRDALRLLGGGAVLLDGAAAAPHLGARERGEPWFTRSGALGLSYLEARIIVARLDAACARAVGIDDAEAARLGDAARAVLFRFFDRCHREDATLAGRFLALWPGLAREIASGACAGLEPARAEALAIAIRDLFAAP